MNQHLDIYSMKALCTALNVSRSGFYAWRYSSQKVKPLPALVSQNYDAHKGKIGAPALTQELIAQGFKTSCSTVARAMRRMGMKAKYVKKFKHTTKSNHKLPVAPNLLDREFNVTEVNKVWVGDITYIATECGWLYLAVVIDLYSRKVVGWQMSHRINQDLVNDALQAALLTRGRPKGVLVHSDRGSQYCSQSYKKILQKHACIASMSRKGNCWDNAVAESFFASLKKQILIGESLKTYEETEQIIFEYIEIYYNRVRRHSNNNWLSPAEYESLNTSTL